MKNKYTNEELSDALNSVQASDSTKEFLEADLAKRNEKSAWGYFMFIGGVLMLALGFSSIIILKNTNDAALGSVFFTGLFFIVVGQYRVSRIKRRNIIIELLMGNKKSEPIK